MRVNFFSQSGNQSNSGPAQGLNATITGPLILAGNPTGPLEATPKQYVDSAINSLNASHIKTGVLSVGRLPAFTGDAASATGSGNFILANTGVVAGTYTKVTVDNKGRVLAGGNITNDDIPPFSWSKINSGKPTTIDGYGITNALKTTGSTVTGTLSLNLDPTDSNHAANKQFVDSLGGTGSNIVTGSIMTRPTSTTPAGFLRANGGAVSKTMYSALFTALKEMYIVRASVNYTNYSALGSGRPWMMQYDFNNLERADISGWTNATTSFPGSIYAAQVLVTKNRVYIIGGVFNGAVTNKVHTAAIDSDGGVGTWSEVSSLALPVARSHAALVVTENHVYLIGGVAGTAASTAGTNTVYVSGINSDGTLNAWSNTNNPLPGTSVYGQAVVTKNRVYLLVGSANLDYVSCSDKLYTAPVNANGTLGAWTVGPTISYKRTCAAFWVTKNRMYITGGITENGNGLGNMDMGVINADGSVTTFSNAENPLYSGSYNCRTFVTKNRVFIYGTSGGDAKAVWTAAIDSDGKVGVWMQATQLNSPADLAQVFATSSRLYVIGASETNTNDVRYAPLTGSMNDYTGLMNGSINKFDGSNITGSFILYDGYDEAASRVVGNGRPWNNQFEINKTQTGPISGWAMGVNTGTASGQATAFVTKNRVYMFGETGACFTSPINTDGTVTQWGSATGSNLPEGLTETRPIVVKNRVYLIGGYTTGPVNKVYTTTINADGTINTWTTTTSLPTNLYQHDAVVVKDRIYVTGGSSTASNKVMYAKITSDGTLTSWVYVDNLPFNIYTHMMAVVKDRVYIFGGHGNNGSTPAITVYFARINTDGSLGAWTRAADIPGPYCQGQVVVTEKMVYLLGGSTTYSSDSNVTYYTTINADGSLGTWAAGPNLSNTCRWSKAYVTSSKIYLIMGWQAGASAGVLMAPFNGGLNDYSPYYDGTITGLDANNFTLPDFSSSEAVNEFYFVKT